MRYSPKVNGSGPPNLFPLETQCKHNLVDVDAVDDEDDENGDDDGYGFP